MATSREELLSTTSQETDALSCMIYPAPAPGKTADFELKRALLSNLPKFRGCNSHEDPDYHLKVFQFVCDSMCPKGADINILKLRAFFFSLKDRALTWFLDLPPGHIDSWDKMATEFHTKFSVSSRLIALRKQIAGIQESVDESYCTYSDALVASCPNHGMSETNLLQYFYDGLLTNERALLDALQEVIFWITQQKLLMKIYALKYKLYEGTLSYGTEEGIQWTCGTEEGNETSGGLHEDP